MLTPMYLRTLIEQSIGTMVGYYRFPNSSDLVKAIAVLPDNLLGDAYPPVETEVLNGLEVVIHKPRTDITYRLSGDGIKTYKWELYINQWNNGDLLKATDLLLEKLHDERLKFTSPTFSSINPGFKTSPWLISYSRIAIIEKDFKKANVVL